MAIASVVATINGTQTTLNWNHETSRYEATIQAPAETSGSNNGGQGPGVGENAKGKGYYPVSITATTTYGASTTVNDETDGVVGAACRLEVVEKVPPTISPVSPTQGALITTGTPEISFTFSDSGSGINTASCVFTVDSEPQTLSFTGTVSDATRTGTYTPSAPLSDGAHTIVCNISDYDGNAATQVSYTFTVDTTDPELVITTPEDNSSISSTEVLATGTVNDAHGIASLVCQVNSSANTQSITVGEEGAFSQMITGLNDTSQNTLTFIATDTSGRTTTIVRHVNVDTSLPVIVSVSISPNPSDAGSTYVLSVEVQSS